jgi:hypothetical protein
MALLSFCGFDTPSLPAQGEQRRSSYFNIPRGNSFHLAAIVQNLKTMALRLLGPPTDGVRASIA